MNNYYWAAQLRLLVAWITQDRDTIWVRMEHSCPDVPLESLPFLSQEFWKKMKMSNECIKVTLKVWSTIRTMFILPTSISRVMKIALNIDFVPSRLDAGFKIWAEKGLNTIDKLLEEF